jgi:hypothetical protein
LVVAILFLLCCLKQTETIRFENFSELADAYRQDSTRGSGSGNHGCCACDAYWAHIPSFELLICSFPFDGLLCFAIIFTLLRAQGAPGDISNVAAQLPVPVGPIFREKRQREEDPRRPFADKDRTRPFDAGHLSVVALAASFRSRNNLVLCAHEINLTWNVEMLGVTSVAGFQSQQRAGSTWTR